MNDPLDQAAAYAAKQLEAAGFLTWLLPRAGADSQRRQWLDTRGIAFPGEPDRHCHTVAGVEHPQGERPPEAIVIEFKDRARGRAALEQLAEYVLPLQREVPVQPGLPDRFLVGSVLVNLTGIQEPRVLVLKAPSLAGAALTFKPAIRDLQTESAPATLRGIARGRHSRCVLVWVPLMLGGEAAGIIEQWKRLALAEPDERKRSDYGAWALIFAERAGRLDSWGPALEGWNMQSSVVIEKWIQQGLLKGRQEGLARGAAILRTKLLHYLDQRFGAAVSEGLRGHIEAQTDLEVLDRWFEQALEAASLDQFRAGLPPQSNGQ